MKPHGLTHPNGAPKSRDVRNRVLRAIIFLGCLAQVYASPLAHGESGSVFAINKDGERPGGLFGITVCCPNNFVAIDPTTGQLTALSSVGDATVGFAGAAAVDSKAHQFFVVRFDSTGIPHLLSIDTRTGTFAQSPSLSNGVFLLGFDSRQETDKAP